MNFKELIAPVWVGTFVSATMSILVFAALPARASCAAPASVAENAQRADAVVYGRILAIGGPPGRPSRFASVQVERVLKGSAYGEIGVGLGPNSAADGGTAVTSVDYEASAATDHVLYLKQHAPLGYTTDTCSGSHGGTPTADEQAFFGVGRPPDRSPRGLTGENEGYRAFAGALSVAALAFAGGAVLLSFRGPRGDARPRRRPRPTLAFAGGLGLGVVVAVATWAVEHSRIAFGPYALYGNGAFAIPTILVPLALYVGGTTLLQELDRVQIAAVAPGAFGLHLGFGTVSMLDGGLTGLPRVVFPGFLFILPTMVLTVATIGLLRSGRLPLNAQTVALAFLLGTILAVVPPLSFFGGLGMSGIATGAAVAAALRASRPGVTVALGLALFALVLTQTFALPIVSQLGTSRVM